MSHKTQKRYAYLILAALLLVVASLACGGSRPPLQFSPDTLPDAQVGQSYNVSITVSGNVTPVGQMSIGKGALPDGLVLQHERGNSTATISGTPQAAGEFEFTVAAWCLGTNVSGQTGQQDYRLVVK